MSAGKKNIVFAYISSTFDYGSDPERWTRFRPTVGLCMVNNLRVDELHLRVLKGQGGIARQIKEDIHEVAKEVKVILDMSNSSEEMQGSDDFDSYYIKIYEVFSKFNFDYENNNYYFFIPPGKGVPYTLAVLLVVTYLNIKCQFIHAKVLFRDTKTRQEVTYSTYNVNLHAWMATISRHEALNLSRMNFLKFNIDTKNKKYNDLIQKLEHVALHSSAPILLSGESGVGKTYLARRIYELKQKARQVTGKFVEVNCGVLKGEGLMSMLFGHVKGAYTGAVGSREGLLKTAHNGVLFLDEISEMPIAEQVVLLKAIEEKSFMPFGSDVTESSNFQLICGTNRELSQAVECGTFRHDLLARISVWHFELPPLRERVEDIGPNIEYELRRYTLNNTAKAQFAPEALQRYLDFAVSPGTLWAGNLRALASSVERMATFARMGVIGEDAVEEEIRYLRRAWEGATAPDSSFSLLHQLLPQDAIDAIDLFDRFHLEGVIQVCITARSRSEAGRILFANSRQNKQRLDDTTRLNNYLKKYGLQWQAIQELGSAGGGKTA